MRLAAPAGVAALLAALGLALLWHLSVGARPVPLPEVWRALVAPDAGVFDHAVVRDLRLPRALSAALAGAALGAAGAVLQAVTGNPLAEPMTLGLMPGASSAVVLGIGWLGLAGPAWVPAFAAGGAVAAGALAWALARAVPGGARPVSLILAGATVAAVLGALDTTALLMDEQAFRDLRAWRVGALSGADLETLGWALPWAAAGLAAALALARPLTALGLGDDAARGLGLPVARLRLLALAAAVALTAAGVSVAGLMGFVGLVVPHAVRLLAGSDAARVVPLSALAGAALLVGVDALARIALAPAEMATGLAATLVGAPVFLWLVRTRA